MEVTLSAPIEYENELLKIRCSETENRRDVTNCDDGENTIGHGNTVEEALLSYLENRLHGINTSPLI